MQKYNTKSLRRRLSEIYRTKGKNEFSETSTTAMLLTSDGQKQNLRADYFANPNMWKKLFLIILSHTKVQTSIHLSITVILFLHRGLKYFLDKILNLSTGFWRNCSIRNPSSLLFMEGAQDVLQDMTGSKHQIYMLLIGSDFADWQTSEERKIWQLICRRVK